uniref:15-oxoprostaglandin 13-reductase n=1 Tax=Saccoglossus kowalevskii TaxID=10224 RepID=A0ABM0MK06_SACKO|nr:PREDICTED: prostaglandin reductase 2-like [Saccoglossus kowalevskii]
MTAANQKIILRSRPDCVRLNPDLTVNLTDNQENDHPISSHAGENNAPSEDNFALRDCSYPELEDGQILVKTLYLSADPYMVDRRLVGTHYSLMLGLYGPPGLAALIGIREKGHLVPDANQTFVVSAAAGACGSLAGQFDNVGGTITDEVIKQMNSNSHIILCGTIATYNTDLPYPPPLSDDIQDIVEDQNITRDRFLVINYISRFPKSIKQLAQWYKQGKLKVRETISGGISSSPKAFISMMTGGNIGKQVVHIAYL